MNRIHPTILLSLTIFGCSLTGNAATFTFKGMAGQTLNWSSSDSWEEMGVPGADDTAVVKDLSLNPSGATVGILNFSGGAITHATLTVNDTFNWTEVTGAGASVGAFGSSGRLIIVNGASANLTGDTFSRSFGANWVIENNGTWNVNDDVILTTHLDSSFQNAGDFFFTGNGRFNSSSSPGPTESVSDFTNLSGGLVEKSGGGGTSVINIGLQNAGTVRANSGVISLIRNGSHSGAFVSDGGVIQFNGGEHRLLLSASLGGTQASLLDSGSLVVDGANVTAVKLTQNGGSVEGDGTLTVSGEFIWNNGTQGTFDGGMAAAQGSTVISQGAVISFPGTGIKTLKDNRTLNSAGTIEVTGDGQIQLNDHSRIESTGDFDISTAVRIQGAVIAPAAVIDNQGTLTKKNPGPPGRLPERARPDRGQLHQLRLLDRRSRNSRDEQERHQPFRDHDRGTKWQSCFLRRTTPARFRQQDERRRNHRSEGCVGHRSGRHAHQPGVVPTACRHV